MSYNFKTKMFALVCLIFFLAFYGCNREVGAGETAPDFSLKDLSGNMVSLKQYRGHIVLIDFWATWCFPCRKAIPELISLQNKYRDQKLVVLGISMDDPSQVDEKNMLEFKESIKINYPILRATHKVIQDYFGNDQIAIPTMFVISREGEIAHKHVGFEQGAVERSIKGIL